MNEDVKSENLRIHSRADELIACLEGEIARRGARILELEADLAGTQSRVLVLQDQWRQLDAELAAIKLYASPVSEAKEQGVVMPGPMKRGDEGGSGEYGAAMIRGYNACLREVARLNATPVQQVSVPDGFVLAKETVVEMPDGSKELGYTTIGRVGIFNSAEEVFDAIRELDLPLGWVSMTTEQLLPGWMLAAAPAAPAADAGVNDHD